MEEEKITYYYYPSPIGELGIAADQKGICQIFLREKQSKPEGKEKKSPLLDDCAEQLNQYFLGKRQYFQLPLSLKGTDFQLQVWQALREIPYGETRAYSDIAAAIGKPKSCRGVGGANHRNPLMIIVPCHRVIGKNGSLVGYGGGLAIKKYLLALEASFKNQQK